MSRAASPSRRRSHAAEDRPLAQRVGARLRKARLEAGMTQAQLAAGRYTKAYVSALENGLSKPSMAALNFFAERLQLPMERFLSDGEPAWTRLEADLRLASGDWAGAIDAYTALLDAGPATGPAPSYFSVWRRHSLVSIADRRRSAPRRGRRRRSGPPGRVTEAALATYWEAYGLYEMEQGDQAARCCDSSSMRSLPASRSSPISTCGCSSRSRWSRLGTTSPSGRWPTSNERERWSGSSTIANGPSSCSRSRSATTSLATTRRRSRPGHRASRASGGGSGWRGRVARERTRARPPGARQSEGRQAACGRGSRLLRRDRRSAWLSHVTDTESRDRACRRARRRRRDARDTIAGHRRRERRPTGRDRGRP